MLYSNNKDIRNILVKLNKNHEQLNLFDNLTLSFLSLLAKEILKIKEINKYPDLVTLSFFIRRKNIEKIISDYDLKNRMPLGIVFHITPSNMPTNFFYSYLFGLFSGNTNLIKIPNKNYNQIIILIGLLNKIFKIKKYNKIKKMSYFFRFDKDSQITKDISSICNCRIIWGSEESINNIRKFPIPPKSREITFSDKYSFTIINSDYIKKVSKKEFLNICNHFYSDAYFVDQNACSSPHLIIWYGKNNIKLRKDFWLTVSELANKKYDMPFIGLVDKISKECEDATNLNIKKNYEFNNILNVNELKKMPSNLEDLRGKWGYFYEYKIKNLNELKYIISEKFQTLSYFGFKRDKLIKVLNENYIKGIDRVVPIGRSHLMDTKWDGYDIIYSLSRIIS